MRNPALLALAILLRAHLACATKVQVQKIGDNCVIKGNEVTWPAVPFQGKLECPSDQVVSLSADKKYGTCCPPGGSLKGSLETEWHCCGEGHDVTGSKAVGFECCLAGSTFDGKMCKREEKCANGKQLVNGKCQCPKGQQEASDGTCKTAKCTSGIETGTSVEYTRLVSAEVPDG